MKRPLIFIFLFFCGLVYCQEPIDSLQYKIADSLYQKAGAIYQSQQDSAILLIHEASTHFKKANALGNYIGCLNVLTAIYNQRNEFDNYKNATQFAVQEALSILSENHPEYATALNYQSVYYSTLGDFENGISRLKTALKIYKDNNVSSLKIATAYHNIGSFYEKKGDYSEAIEYVTQALNLRQDTLDKSIQLGLDTVPLNRVSEINYKLNESKQAIAWAHYKNKNYDKALVHFESSLQVFRNLKKYDSKSISNAIIISLQSIAKIYQIKGETDQAYKYIREAIQFQLKNNAFRKAHSFEILGRLDLEKGELLSAAKNFEKSLAILEQKKGSMNLPSYARKLNSLGHVKEQMGALEEAINYYQRALKVLAPGFEDDLKNPPENMLYSKPDALDILKNKGGALWNKYQETNNQKTLELAYNSYQSGIDVIKAIRQGVVTKEAKNILAEKSVSIYEGALQTALKLYDITSSEELLLDVFSIIESSKSMLLLEAINEQSALGIKGLPDSLIQKDKALRLEIAFFQRQLIEANQKQIKVDDPRNEKLKKQLFDSKGALTQLTDFFEQNYPRFYQLKYQNEASSIAQCQQLLGDKNQALIEYFYGEKNIYGFVVWENGFEYFLVGQHQNVTEAIEKLQASIRSIPSEQDYLDNYQNFTSLASYLYQTILAPGLELLPEDISSIKIIPDDQLNYIPFDILLMEEPKSDLPYFDTDHMEYVLEKYSVSYEYSVALMMNNEHKNQESYAHDFLAYAPSFQKATIQPNTRSCQRELYDLSCNKKEVDEINELMDGTTYLANSGFEVWF